MHCKHELEVGVSKIYCGYPLQGAFISQPSRMNGKPTGMGYVCLGLKQLEFLMTLAIKLWRMLGSFNRVVLLQLLMEIYPDIILEE